jgi:hypothetical protein
MRIEKKLNQMKTGPSRFLGEHGGFQKGLETDVLARAKIPYRANHNDNETERSSGDHACLKLEEAN